MNLTEDIVYSAPKPERDKRPDISHLDFALDDDGNFIPDVGDRIVIERCASLVEGSPWLDTCLYTILAIDRETGSLKLRNEEFKHYSFSNYVDGTLMGYSFRIPPQKGSLSQMKNASKPFKRKVQKKAKKVEVLRRRVAKKA
jgi:hypothetical protein